MTETPTSLSDATRRGVKWTGLSAVSTAGLQLLQIAVLARVLDHADFGRMAMVLVMLSIGSTFAELGLSSAIIQRPELRPNELATLYVLNLLAGLVLFLLIWATAPLMSALINLGDMTSLIRAAASVFLIAPWALQFRALLQKRLEFGLLTKLNLAAQLAGTLTAIALAFLGFGVWALLGGYLATEVITTASLVTVGIRRSLWSGMAWDLPAVRDYVVFGGFRLAAMLVNAVNARVDQLAIGMVMGASALGLYNVAQKLALEPVQLINPVVTRVAFPVLSLAQGQPERLRRGYLRMNGLLLGVSAPLLLGLAATAHVVVPVVLGPNWNDAVVVVRLLAICALFRSIANAAGSLLMAKGRADWSFYMNVAKLLVVPATIVPAVLLTGSLTGVAAALLLLQVLLLIPHYFLLLRHLIGNCGGEYLQSILRPSAAAALMAVGVWCLDLLLFTGLQPLLRLVVLVTIGTITYSAISFLVQRELLEELIRLLGLTSNLPERARNR